MEQFLSDLRGPSPAHAAGLAGMMSGAAGAALFVKCRYRPAEGFLTALKELAASDGPLFAEYLRARRAGEPFETSLRATVESPLRGGEMCLELASHYGVARRGCPRSMLGDLFVGKRLLQACAECCQHLAGLNLELCSEPWQAARERLEALEVGLGRLQEQEAYDRIFQTARTVAVVGISDRPERAGYYVPRYLRGRGFRLLGVNPRASSSVAEKTASTLRGLEEPIDLVIFFRRSEALGEHLEDILGLTPLPRTAWLQEGIRNEDFASALRAVDIQVVSDRCALREHQVLYPEAHDVP